MKKTWCFLVVLMILLTVVGCGSKKTVHCDHCQKEVLIDEDSNMEEDWIIYCNECNEELFGDDPLLGNG
ncbi:MAG: hypothetical protein IKU51_05530 [Clostridia bacterium]|nr:hypothetical protein [Clostridia bacterium]